MEARKAKKLTQEGLGKNLGTDGKDASKAVVYGWEKDQHYPRVDQLVLICDKLDESADYLLFGRRPTVANLTPEVSALAEAIEKLTKPQRDWVLMVLRNTIELAPQAIPNTAPNVIAQNDSAKRRSAAR